MTVKDIDKLFETDDNDCFMNLILPQDMLGSEMDLRGKKRLELDLDTIVRVKKYANMLYETALKA